MAAPGGTTETGTMLCGAGMSIVERHLEWLAQRARAASTIYQRRRYLERLTAYLDTPLLHATRQDLLAWRATFSRHAPASVLAAVTHITEFYKWADAEGLLPGPNPAVRIPVPRRRRGLPRPVSEETAARVLDAAPARIRPWLVLAGWCGLRACEIAGLRAESILETGAGPVLIVDADSAKGGKERLLPLSAWVLEELRAAGIPARGYVFRGAAGGRLSAPAVTKAANRYLRLAGAGCTLHQWRHRFATAVYRETGDVLLVAELLGHASPATTAVYAKVDVSRAAAAVAGLPVPGRLRLVAEG